MFAVSKAVDGVLYVAGLQRLARYSQEVSQAHMLNRKLAKTKTKIVTLRDQLAESQMQKAEAERRVAETERLLREAVRDTGWVGGASCSSSHSKRDAHEWAPLRMLWLSVVFCVFGSLLFLRGTFHRSIERKVLLSLLVPSFWLFLSEMRRPSAAGASFCVAVNWFLVGFVCHALLLQPQYAQG